MVLSRQEAALARANLQSRSAAAPDPGSALTRTYAPGRHGRRQTITDRIGLLFAGGIVLLAASLAGGGLYDNLQRERARPEVLARWPAVRRILAQRLNQGDPLEFGAVWATHSGMVCGLVNGRGSFGGLAGMTPFAVDGERPVFALDETALDFAAYWRECTDDQWISILQGSMQAGGCATRLGQARCVTMVTR